MELLSFQLTGPGLPYCNQICCLCYQRFECSANGLEKPLSVQVFSIVQYSPLRVAHLSCLSCEKNPYRDYFGCSSCPRSGFSRKLEHRFLCFCFSLTRKGAMSLSRLVLGFDSFTVQTSCLSSITSKSYCYLSELATGSCCHCAFLLEPPYNLTTH